MNKVLTVYLMTMAFALWLSLAVILAMTPKPVEIIPMGFTSRDMQVDLPDIEYVEVERTLPRIVDEVREIRRRMGELTVAKTRLVLGNDYRMFITSYCSAECGGSTMTSSGATVHRSDDPYEPTTCAIDRRYFSYGDLFYVPSEDRVYIAEDTGSAVKGLHIDLFQNSMSEVSGYNTRYETIYRCEFEEYEVILSNYDIREQIALNCFGKRGNV